MSWRTITEDDVYSALNAAEAAALRTAFLRPGQEDPLPVIIAQVTGQVRDAIRSHRDNTLSPTATHVPEGLVPAAVDLILYRLSQRMGRTMPLTEDRTDAWRAANAHLKDIARGVFAVEQFGADEDDRAPSPTPRITSRDRRFTRTTQDGI